MERCNARRVSRPLTSTVTGPCRQAGLVTMNNVNGTEPISNAELEILKHNRSGQSNKEGHQKEREHNGQHVQSARWWYASTVFPLLAGTFGPMANAFSVSALVTKWRLDLPVAGDFLGAVDIPDPHWLIVVNAVSLVLAIVANLSLLLNMTKRVRFEIAQPITIAGFWLASILLIVLVSYTGTSPDWHAPGVQYQASSAAFYYAIYAAALYQIIAYLMCATVLGAYMHKYPKDFELTPAQRTLMLQTISFLVYMHLGALIYAKIEGWRYLDAVYWADFTLLTVGIGGNFVPTTDLGRGLVFPFAIGGIITIGLVISSVRTLVLERGAQKMSARMQEKVRQQVVRQIAALESGKTTKSPGLFKISKKDAQQLTEAPTGKREDELERRRTEFHVMRQVQKMAVRNKRYTSLLTSTLAFALLWFVGAEVFRRSEHEQQWTYFSSLYFSYTSVLTIGYGDLTPSSDGGKSFFVFWSLLAVPTLTVLISDMGDTVVKGVKDVTIYLGEITVLPSDKDSILDRIKYGLYRATLGRFRLSQEQQDEEAAEGADSGKGKQDDFQGMKEMHPGLIQLFGGSDEHEIGEQDIYALNELARVWNVDEGMSEEAARQNHDRKLEAEHHYRRLLITQIPKVYGHTKYASPKHYSYIEWTFYLRLLGEDESDGRQHRMPSHTYHGAGGRRSNSTARPPARDQSSAGQPWSWIGQRSPLMSDKLEAEWILQRLFQKLEESFRSQSHLERANEQRWRRLEQQHESQQPDVRSHEKGGSTSGSSLHTLGPASLRRRPDDSTQSHG